MTAKFMKDMKMTQMALISQICLIRNQTPLNRKEIRVQAKLKMVPMTLKGDMSMNPRRL